jgi:hypothetical protein
LDTGGSYVGLGDHSAQLVVGSAQILNSDAGVGATVTLGGTMLLDASGGSITCEGGSCGGLRDCTPPVLLAQGAAQIRAESLSLSGGGTVELGQGSDTEVSGDVTVDGSSNPGLRDATPPVFRAVGDATVAVDGSLAIRGAAEVALSSTQALELGGDLDNQGTDDGLFDASGASLTLAGGTWQSFEVAGRDLGPTTNGFVGNFAVGAVEVQSSGLVRFQDTFDNDGLPQIACGEALYVTTLTLRAQSTVRLEECRVYAMQLVDEGASILTSGCGKIVLVASGDFDFDGDVDLDDLAELLTCLDGPSSGPMEVRCGVVDFDADEDVDLFDVAQFQEAFTG